MSTKEQGANQTVQLQKSVSENIYCGYSLEVPQPGTSNEYP